MQLKKHDLSLTSTFEAKGRWWLPESPRNWIGGTLSYSSDGIVLELHGTLSSRSLSEHSILGNDLERFPLIHGDTDVGPCTLVKAYLSGFDHNLSEATKSSYSAIYLMLGNHVTEAELPSNSVSFSCSNLDDFLGLSSFSVEDDRGDNTFRGMTVRYVVPESLVFDLPSESAQLEFEQNLLRSESRTKISLTARHTITIKPSTSQPFQWHLERVWRMCYLLTLLTDEEIRPERIEVRLAGDSYPHVIFWKSSGARVEEKRTAGLLLFYSGHVLDQLSDILNRWFTASPTLTSAIHLFMDGQRQHGSSEGRFLTLSQAFEAFSRATTTSEYMAAADYEAVKTQIIAAIPKSVASDHRDSLKSRIKFGNESSLRKRLLQAVESLTPDAIDCICKSPQAFVAGIVDTRNYLTHNTVELRASALRGANLLWASERLAMLLRVLLLRELGIDVAKIVKQVREHPRLLQYRHLYHSHPEKM